MDLHHNIFYSYRGPANDNSDRDSQLENNLTKALVNTLQLGGRQVLEPFLAELKLPKVSQPKFLLQRRDLPSGGAWHKKHRVLLGLSKQTSQWSSHRREKKVYDSLPDAWIYGDDVAILIESKVNDGAFDPFQMSSHLTRLNRKNGGDPIVVLKTWEEIHGIFRRIAATLTNDHGCAAFLVMQFIQFLEYSGMTGFTGFRPDHFDYFITHDDDDTRGWVLDQIKSLAGQVLAGLRKVSPSFSNFYEDFDVGNFSREMDYCWVAFGPRGDAYRKLTHQTVELRANGVAVFVNTELKPATDRLKRVLRDTPFALRQALELVAEEPFELVVQERVQRRPRVMDYFPVMTLHSNVFVDQCTADVAWRTFVEMIDSLPLPYLQIRRLIPRKNLLDLTGGYEGVQQIVEMIEGNHQIVDLLNLNPNNY